LALSGGGRRRHEGALGPRKDLEKRQHCVPQRQTKEEEWKSLGVLLTVKPSQAAAASAATGPKRSWGMSDDEECAIITVMMMMMHRP
jgi:hypothetical protein